MAQRERDRTSGLTLSFHGGARTVTGSRYLVRSGERTVEVDTGMFQGLKELRLLNWQRPAFDPGTVDALLLTHAHMDHIGYLPKLVREGFRGLVYATRPTVELAPILLYDGARLQEEDADFANRHGFSKHKPALPLYTTSDVDRAVRRLRPIDYGQWLELGDGLRARFQDAGHILGSAAVELRSGHGAGAKTVVFSGDVGQFSAPLQRDPAIAPACDALVLESTYGDRRHSDVPIADQLRGPFRKTLAAGGTVLIPSFAVARVQLAALVLVKLMESGGLPRTPIHVDSPMAVEVTSVYRRYNDSEYLDPELPGSLDPLESHLIQYHRTVAESKALNDLPGPRIIISSSGMLTGGRVLHHLRRLISDAKNLVALVGYQAPGTRGRALQDGTGSLRMHGEVFPVRAAVVSVNGFSAHADADDLLRWVRSARGPIGRVFLTHGEPEAAEALARRLREELHLRADVPAMGDTFEI